MKTDRLILSLITESDISEVLNMFAEPDMFKYIQPHRDKTPEQFRSFLLGKIEQIEAKTGYYWVVRNEQAQLVGAINLTPIPTSGQIQIGWQMSTNFRNRGFAFEAAEAVFKYALTDTAFDPIFGVFETENVASEKILKRLGFVFYATFTEGATELQQYIYQR